MSTNRVRLVKLTHDMLENIGQGVNPLDWLRKRVSLPADARFLGMRELPDATTLMMVTSTEFDEVAEGATIPQMELQTTEP
jgi:hypothetical protein